MIRTTPSNAFNRIKIFPQNKFADYIHYISKSEILDGKNNIDDVLRKLTGQIYTDLDERLYKLVKSRLHEIDKCALKREYGSYCTKIDDVYVTGKMVLGIVEEPSVFCNGVDIILWMRYTVSINPKEMYFVK